MEDDDDDDSDDNDDDDNDISTNLAVIPRLVKLNEKRGNVGEKLIGFKYKVIWQR